MTGHNASSCRKQELGMHKKAQQIKRIQIAARTIPGNGKFEWYNAKRQVGDRSANSR